MTHTFETTVGDRIGRLREQRGMTQERMAARAGVSADVVRKLGQNRRLTARTSTLNALAQAHADLDQDGRAAVALLKAEDDAPEWMRYHGTSRRLVAELRSRERRRRSPVTELADRLHLHG